MMKKEEFLKFYKNSECFELTEDMISDDAELVVGNIDLPITTRCTLRCKHCANLIPQYKNASDFSLDNILDGLNKFLECIDLVVRVNVLGGEPMMHPQLAEIIEALNSSPKVYHTVLTTNGTVIPDNSKLYEALQNPKNEVRISEYAQCKKKSQELEEKLRSNNVYYTIKNFGQNDFLWYDFGGFENRIKSPQCLEQQYKNCDVEWHSLLNGRLYPCPRAAHATDIGLLPDNKKNYIDFFDEEKSLSKLKAELEDFIFKRKYFPACRLCDRGTDKCKQVLVAQQI